MKKLSLIVLMAVCVSGYGQNRYHVDEIDYSTEIHDGDTTFLAYLKKDSLLINGIIYEEYDNGQLLFEDNYKNGLAHGLWKSWHKNGQLANKGKFKNDKFISQKCWDQNGKEINCEDLE